MFGARTPSLLPRPILPILQRREAEFHSNSFPMQNINLGSDLWVRMSVTERLCVDLTDVTLADEDTNSILTDNANRAIQGNVAMQVMQSGGQLWKQCKWRHLVAKSTTYESGTIWWSNL